MKRKNELEVLIPYAGKSVLELAGSVSRINSDLLMFCDFSFIDSLKDEIKTLEALKREYQTITKPTTP